MSVLHRAVDAMLATLRQHAPKPITITGLSVPDDASATLKPGQVVFGGSAVVRIIQPDMRDAGRQALAAALLELAATASPGTRFELRAIAHELSDRCPDCGRHLTRDPWRHCATCEPQTTPGVPS